MWLVLLVGKIFFVRVMDCQAVFFTYHVTFALHKLTVPSIFLPLRTVGNINACLVGMMRFLACKCWALNRVALQNEKQ